MTMTMIAAAASQKRSGRPFIIKVNYASGFTVTLPLYNAGGYNYNFIVDWGDGSVGQVTSATDSDRIHTYSSGGTYTITMTGTLEGWSVNSGALKSYLIEVTQFGRTGLKFFNCRDCTRLVACYGKLDTSSFTTLTYIFGGCTNLTTLDVSTWDTSLVENMTAVFLNCNKLTTIDVSGWDTSACTLMSNTFNGCLVATALDVSGWDVSKVTTFTGMFQNTNVTSLNLSNWVFKTTGEITINNFLHSNTKITTLGDVSGWVTTPFTTMAYMFYSCQKLTTLDVSTWDVQNVTLFNDCFYMCRSLTSIDVSGWNVSKCTNFTNMFRDCRVLTEINISSWTLITTSNITMERFAQDCTKLTSTNFDISGWYTTKITNMSRFFLNCTTLSSLDFSNKNFSTCTTFDAMFQGCSNLSTLNVSGWTLNTTSNVSMSHMFDSIKATSLSFTGWNTSKVTNFSYFIYGSKLTSIDVSGWDTSAATNFSSFAQLSSLTSINLSMLNMSNVTNTAYLLQRCGSLTSISLPSSLSVIQDQFATLCPLIAVYNIYRSAAPTVSGTPFSNYAKPLHVPVSNSGYNVAPWTNTAIFSSIINDL